MVCGMIRPLVAAALALLPLPALAQDLSPAEVARVDRIVTTALARTGTPSATVAIVRGGRMVYAHGWGKASETLPATAAVPYQIASISKQFTAAAMLLLQRDGKLNLDDHVSRYLSGITGGDTITLRELLSHTAGLQDYWPQDYSFAAMSRPVTPQAIVDRWARKPLDFAPGTQWQYSNTGYVVAGLIVEKVAGEPLLAFLQQRLFKPLGITATDQDMAVGPTYPVGYQRFALGPVRVERPAARGWLFAAGELSMNAPDLAKWDIARLDRQGLSPADWAAQETEVMLADGKGTGYGLGVDVGKDAAGHRFVEHSGEAVGFLTENIVYPDDKAAVVVFTNADFGNAYTSIARDIAGVILPAGADGEAGKTAEARRVFDSLRAGTLNRAVMTADSNYYFTPTALADYKASLSALGEPQSFAPLRGPKLRGGFVNRNYTVTYPDRKLIVVTYAEPGEHGRYEQFLVQPAN
jgi:CubicO group peptidase (beta-lactamase class C family)